MLFRSFELSGIEMQALYKQRAEPLDPKEHQYPWVVSHLILSTCNQCATYFDKRYLMHDGALKFTNIVGQIKLSSRKIMLLCPKASRLGVPEPSAMSLLSYSLYGRSM